MKPEDWGQFSSEHLIYYVCFLLLSLAFNADLLNTSKYMLWAKTVAGFMQRLLIIARELVFGNDREVASYCSMVRVIA